MELSAQGFDLLGIREAKRNVAYRDSKGIWTIGIGHTGPEVHEGLVWTDAQVMDTYLKDAAWVMASLALVRVALTQNQFDALFSFVFNIGGGQWASSTLLRHLNDGHPMDEVDEHFDQWHEPPEVTTRRNGEKFQFLGTTFAARCDAEGNPVA